MVPGVSRQATPTRGATLLMSVSSSAVGKRSGERTVRARQHRHRRGEVGRDVEVHHVPALLDERQDQLVADAEVERQLRALPPVVLQKRLIDVPDIRTLPGPVLHRRLLRQAEQEVGEVEPAAARGLGSAGGVQAREHERAARVGVGLAVDAIEADVAAEAQRVPRERPRPGVRRRDPPIRAPRRRDVAQAREAREGERRHAPVERIGRDAGDAGSAGDVLDARVLVPDRDTVREKFTLTCESCGDAGC